MVNGRKKKRKDGRLYIKWCLREHLRRAEFKRELAIIDPKKNGVLIANSLRN